MIRYYRCATCGKRGMDISPQQNRRFCSKQCCANYFNNKRYGGEVCDFNEGVLCKQRNCRKCGWNPKVAKKRMEALA